MQCISPIVKSVIPAHICTMITEQYYANIPTKTDFEHVVHDKDFIDGAKKSVTLFGDHGLHHVTNVAEQVPLILKSILRVYIPKREAKRLDFIERYGILIGFIHDIGMSDVTKFGRTMHGEFVAQEIFQPRFQPIFRALWEENVGNIPWTLLSMYHRGCFKQSPELIFREMLSLSVCHRKTLVPINILNNPQKLQKQMQYYIANTLHYQYYQNQIINATNALTEAKQTNRGDIAKLTAALATAKNNLEHASRKEVSPEKLHKVLANYYQDFSHDCFAWLLNPEPKMHQLIADIVDTLRIIRCSDALRQRGTELKTSAQFQIFVNQFTAQAIYALTKKNGKMYFLELDDEVACGEANVASSCFTKEGDLRFEFSRGYFHNTEATARALNYLAALIVQLDYDIFDTFIRGDFWQDGFVARKRPRILLEKTEDCPQFTHLLVEKLVAINPALDKTVVVVPSLKNIPQIEYLRYLKAEAVTWDDKQKLSFLKRVAATGQKIKHVDIHKAFQNARLARATAKEIVFEVKTLPGFVYFPFASGLVGYPTGSYSPFNVTPFTPLGTTGVIRGDVRNATVIANKPVQLLVIPKDDYLAYWFASYAKDEFVRLVKNKKIK